MNHRPVCVKCECELRPEKNGVGLLDHASFGPYKLWQADKYKCPKCGIEIVVGFSEGAIHYNSNSILFKASMHDHKKKDTLINCREHY